jgi:hypothetical protein
VRSKARQLSVTGLSGWNDVPFFFVFFVTFCGQSDSHSFKKPLQSWDSVLKLGNYQASGQEGIEIAWPEKNSKPRSTI